MIRAVLARLRRVGALLVCLTVFGLGTGHGSPLEAIAAEIAARVSTGETGHRHGGPGGHGPAHQPAGAATQCCPTLPEAVTLPCVTAGVGLVPPTPRAILRGLQPAPQTPPPRVL